MSDLNAFLYRDEAAKGGNGPLSGVTVGVKANIAVRDMPFHGGIGAWADRRAERDAEVVAKLRAAGAIITGILNMEEGALGSKTDNPHFGPTHNPHRHGYSPGGSSGGSGAAVAAGQCDIALGTDTLGSIRIPAAHCGVYGFKPATDRVSQDGLIPADPAFDAIGPLTRDLDALELAARTVSDFGDRPIVGHGAILDGHGVALHAAVASGYARAVDALPEAPEPVRLTHPAGRVRYAGFIQVSRRMASDFAGVSVSGHLAKLLTFGPQRPEDKWRQDQHILADASREVRRIVEQHGFLLMPTVPNPAFPLSEPEPAAQADFTCLANIAGLPALAIPAGWTGDGLPVSVQIIGAAGAEAGLFRIARHLDRALNAYRPPARGEAP